MKTILLADPIRYPRMNTEELRSTFLVEGSYSPGVLNITYVDPDRAVVGMAAPAGKPIALPTYPELRASYFTERRELGILNIGGTGAVCVQGRSFTVRNLDVLYVGRGIPDISFESQTTEQPAIFYLLSYPAHRSYPVTLITKEEAKPTPLGSQETCNQRIVNRYIHLEGARSCQLVMGVTTLSNGSAWNTMPPHTHMRRSEIYMYFNLAPDARVFHLMGPPKETRHLVLANRDIVISPGWSIHAGMGTRAYSFCWGMGGENQDYADMDPAPLDTLL